MDRIKEKIRTLYGEDINYIQVSQEKLNEYGLTEIELRTYQEAGIEWLVERYQRHHGCVLADEMGLGKTCQTISFLVYLHGSEKNIDTHLVVCPLSVIANWQNEFSRFAPQLKVITYVGDKDRRNELRSKIERKIKNIDVVLTTYEICLKDESFLRRFSWHTLVVDEAHRLKNRNSLLYQALSEFDIRHRILLTGTPVQNNLEELYSLLSFCSPRIFREKFSDAFLSEYSEVQNTTDASDLHTLLKPFLLRRVKSDVLHDLPERSEVIMYHGLSALQKKYYHAILTKDLDAFENSFHGPKTRLMNILIQLRKCVNHPYLFDGVEPEPFQLGEHLVEASGKLVLLDQMLKFMLSRKHKVLIFSQMTRMLDILQDYLGYRGFSYERLDGSVRGEERHLAVNNFNKDEDTFIFLLSTKAGGQGLNLVAADTIIFVDSDFNPQNDLQAAARAHRIGQTRRVKVIRLVGRSTVEEIILKRAQAKLKLTHAVIEGGQFAVGVDKTSLIADSNTKLQDILKFGVDKLFADKESSIEDTDLELMLGPSVNGEWQVEEQIESQSCLLETEEEAAGNSTQNMYVFEGTDYSQEPSTEDKNLIDEWLQAKNADELDEAFSGERSMRKNKSNVFRELPEMPRKTRKQLSPEELEERKKKRAETLARKAQEAEERELQKAQQQKKKKEALWAANDYSSCNVDLSEEEEGSDSQEGDLWLDDEDDDDSSRKKDIRYVSGDVTRPVNTAEEEAIIGHCVDDSGWWGRGGVFSALSARSTNPEEQYSLAGKMKDLSLGDAHLIPLKDDENEEEKVYVALMVAQHRDRRNNLSGIKLTALSQCFDRLYKAAKKKRASVHLPRIGYNTPGFNWYGTERLIRKLLAARGIATYVYYYPRGMKRQATSYTKGPPQKVRKTDDDNSGEEDVAVKNDPPDVQPSTSAADSASFLEGMCVYFYNIPDDTRTELTKSVICYDGDVHTTIEDSTTHVIAILEEDRDKSVDDLKEMLMDFDGAVVVTVDWLQDSVKQEKKLPVKKYTLHL